MEALIPNGSRRILREPEGGRQGRDCSSEKRVTRVNPEFEAWELQPGEVLERGEFVAVLPGEE